MNPDNLRKLRWLLLWALLACTARPLPILGQTPGILSGPVVNLSNGHVYYLLEPASWTNAEAAAINLGGHLATINSLDENSWVYDEFCTFAGVSRDLWIGFYLPDPDGASTNRAIRLGEFRWISGQPVDFTLMSDTNLIFSGYCQMTGPADSSPAFEGYWTEEEPTVLRNSVVELPLPLEIISQPKSISVGIGADATFTVFADGTTPLRYQWQSSGINLPGQTKESLTFTNLQPNEFGVYSVEVSNESGSITSAPAYLTVAGIVGWGSTGAFDSRTNVPPGLTSVAAIAAGNGFNLALKPEGTVVGWGNNDYKQLDIPSDLSNVVAIAGALYHSLALKSDGTVVSWGYDIQTGNWVPDGLTNVVAIDAYGYHNVALQSNGTVVSWGGGDGAQPSVSPTGLSNVVAVAAGDGQNVALESDGTVVCWDDTSGLFTPVPPEATNVVAVAGGEGDILVLKADGTVVGWGENWLGQLDIPSGLSNVVAICARSLHSLALKSDGTVVGWGNNYGGESTVPPGLPNVVAISGGYNHSLALLRDGTPNLTVQPWDQSVAAGSSSILMAKAVGLQSMGFQWQFDGHAIPGATRDSLSITNIQPSDAGLYNLSVSNPVAVVSSRRAKLVVSAPLRLQPLSLSGQIATLKATGPIGRDYILQVSSNLSSWTDLQTNSSMQAVFSVTNLNGPAQQFYRVRLGGAGGN